MTATESSIWDGRALALRLSHLANNYEKLNETIDERLVELQEKMNASFQGVDAKTSAHVISGENESAGS